MLLSSEASVKLGSTVRSSSRPSTVLIHGLDSSKHTWHSLLSSLASRAYPALALDLRGHGESPLGDPQAFSARALAEDVIEAARAHGVEPGAVLVGHSMGGRIAMRVAAIDGASPTPLFKAVVIEDMDLRPMYGDNSEPHAALKSFEAIDGRRFADWQSARSALLPWYDEARVDGWKNSRIRPLPKGGWWSDINPAAQRLARNRVLASTDGAEAWDSLNAFSTKVYLWYADQPGTVCEVGGPGGIEDMAKRLPTAEVRFFPGSDHSIHNSAREEFVAALCKVVDDVASISSESA
ncbi:MAG: hypothetical protein SGPRY_001195 [Prymnesium sp.]